MIYPVSCCCFQRSRAARKGLAVSDMPSTEDDKLDMGQVIKQIGSVKLRSVQRWVCGERCGGFASSVVACFLGTVTRLNGISLNCPQLSVDAVLTVPAALFRIPLAMFLGCR